MPRAWLVCKFRVSETRLTATGRSREEEKENINRTLVEAKRIIRQFSGSR